MNRILDRVDIEEAALFDGVRVESQRESTVHGSGLSCKYWGRGQNPQ